MSFRRISEGYYTAAEARVKLGLTEAAFQGWVKAKKVNKVLLPGKKQGMYLKHEIDQLAISIDAASLTVRYPLRFEKATLETQVEEFKLATLNFGEGTNRFNEKRIELLKKNPDMSYYLWDGNFLVASINIVPLTHEAILRFKDGERGWLLGDYVEQYQPGHPLELIVIDCMTTPLAPENRRKQYAQRLFSELAGNVFVDWAQQGIEIESIHACGGTPDGRSILEHAHFTYLGEPRTNRHIYELNLAESDWKLLIPYRLALAEYRQRYQKGK